MFYQNQKRALIFGFTTLKLFYRIYYIILEIYWLVHASVSPAKMLNFHFSLMHYPHLTCMDFWLPVGKGVLLCLIHHLAHYCANGLISTALLSTFSCLKAATNERVLLPWPPQTHNKVSGFLSGEKWHYEKTLAFLYVPGWHLTLHTPQYEVRSGFKPLFKCVHVDVNTRYFFLFVCVCVCDPKQK